MYHLLNEASTKWDGGRPSGGLCPREHNRARPADCRLMRCVTAGVTPARIFVDKASGAAADRPGLGKCLEFLQAGDLLLVWRLDRLGRSMVHLVELVEELQQRGVGLSVDL